MIPLAQQFCREGLAIASSETLLIEDANELFSSMLGITRSTSEALALKGAIPHFDEQAMRRAFESRKAEYVIEAEIRPTTGRPTPVKITLRPISQDNGTKIGVRIADNSEIVKHRLLIKSVEELLDSNKRRAEEAQKNFKTILDCLPQGFLTVDSRGIIGQDYSAEIINIFGESPAGKNFWELTSLNGGYCEVADLAFAGADWDTVNQLFPSQCVREGKLLELKFVPMYSDDRLHALVIACQDVTNVRSLMEFIEKQTRQAKIVFAVLSARAEFLELLELASSLEAKIEDPKAIATAVHTIKGGFSIFECHELADFCHAAETTWAETTYEPSSGLAFCQDLRHRIDSFLAEYRDFLRIARPEDIRRKELIVDMEPLARLYHQISGTPLASHIKSDLISHIEEAVSQPLSITLGWLERIWQETLREVGKSGSRIQWQSTVLIPRDPYKRLFQSLLHVVRNAAVHGIETQEERANHSKPPEGSLVISCECSGSSFIISIEDDGQGIDLAAVRRVAMSRGITEADLMTDQALLEVIFSPLFSIRTEADELAGRGIGLAVVRQEARALGGDATVVSTPGKGTKFTITFQKQALFTQG